jgi:hypothetical protein
MNTRELNARGISVAAQDLPAMVPPVEDGELALRVEGDALA